MKSVLRKALHRVGYDVYRYPYACERLLPHLSMLMNKYNIDMIVDVGANIGQFAREIRSISDVVPIHSVEPNPNALNVLEDAAKKDALWRVYGCALGSVKGRGVLNISTADDFSSLLKANEFGMKRFDKDLEVAEEIEVEIITLDDLINSIKFDGLSGSNILLKMDTQGFDMEVMKGGKGVMDRVSVIVTEASLRPIYEGASLFEDVFRFMGDRGFALSGFFPVSRNEDFSVIEADCVFVRSSGH